MALSAKTIRSQIQRLLPLISNCSIETTRKGQNMIGELMEKIHRHHVIIKEHTFPQFSAAWILPKDERRQGVILYLHGGGYVCGDLEYAKGFGATLAAQCGCKVFCPGYRLAPEHPFPAALEDSLAAYRYLLEKGYHPGHITLCGESAGGGLCYSVCAKLQEAGLDMPAGIIAISPWTDLTASGPSYTENKAIDPSMTAALLDFYATNYCTDRTDPLVSPLFAPLHNIPPSLLFVGADEIMRSDAELLHQKLLDAGCKSKLTVAPERWHGYLLYNLAEDQQDFAAINQFLDLRMSEKNKLRWMRLDNAAKIYPAALRAKWSNVFRLSATLTEEVDPALLQSALDVTARRFPSIATRLRKGVFWYYLQELEHAPPLTEESSYPLTHMRRRDLRKCAFRVIAYKNRIAVEFFHSLTDGTGGLIFLKTLVAEYLQQRYGISIPPEHGVLGRLEEPQQYEFVDSFQEHAGQVAASRKEPNAWHLQGTPEPGGFLNLTCFTLSTQAVLEKAHEYGVSLTVFLGAAMMMALQNLQAEKQPNIRRRKHIKVLLPVNLRNIFPSRTLRNFALYVTPEIDPRLGHFDFKEICNAIRHKMGLEINQKQMSAKIATNVNSERLLVVKLMPLFIKNMVMKAVFDSVGEIKSCLSLSNLGNIQLPEAMEPYVQRFDFILGPQASKPHNCGVLSYRGKLYINFIRNIREPELEDHFFRVLRDMGLSAEVQSNQP